MFLQIYGGANQINQGKQVTSTDENLLIAKFKCSKADREKFPHSKCVIPISVGQEYHEGQKLSAILAAVDSCFKECVVIIGDSLQKYNFLATKSCSAELAHKLALELGDAWLVRNKEKILSMNIKTQIIRWDEMLQHRDYQSNKKIIDDLYTTKSNFTKAVEDMAEMYIQRKNVNDPETKKYAIEYIKEECAGYPVLQAQGFLYEIYPSKMPIALTIALNQCSTPAQKLMKGIFLKFNSKKNYEKI